MSPCTKLEWYFYFYYPVYDLLAVASPGVWFDTEKLRPSRKDHLGRNKCKVGSKSPCTKLEKYIY